MDNKKVNDLIAYFDLKRHPEGGFYKQVYKSKRLVSTQGASSRASITSIYYLISGADFSAFHRLDADETWHYYQGNTNLIIHQIDVDGKYQKTILGSQLSNYQFSIPAHCWFGAELSEKNDSNVVLVGCTVAPGFEFDRFELAKREDLLNQYPDYQKIIQSLTRLENYI